MSSDGGRLDVETAPSTGIANEEVDDDEDKQMRLSYFPWNKCVSTAGKEPLLKRRMKRRRFSVPFLQRWEPRRRKRRTAAAIQPLNTTTYQSIGPILATWVGI